MASTGSEFSLLRFARLSALCFARPRRMRQLEARTDGFPAVTILWLTLNY